MFNYSYVPRAMFQIATYYSSKAFRNHVDETVVCEKIEGIVPPGESCTWDEQGPRVPPIPPSSTMIDCKLITLDYRLDVSFLSYYNFFQSSIMVLASKHFLLQID